MTLVAPVFIKAKTTEQLKDAGYEVAETYMGFRDLGIAEGQSGQAVIDAWEPERPDGDGWFLAHKGWLGEGWTFEGENYKIRAIWAREDLHPARDECDDYDRLRRDVSEAYQAVGVMVDIIGWWEMPAEHPWHKPIEKLMDNLAAAAGGEPREHEDLLPFELPKQAEPESLCIRFPSTALLYTSLKKWGFLDRPVHDGPINGGDLVEWFTTTFVPQAREILRHPPETNIVQTAD